MKQDALFAQQMTDLLSVKSPDPPFISFKKDSHPLTIKTLVLQRSVPMAQTFAAVHSSSVIVKGNGGLGACPLKKSLELHSLQRWKMPFCKIGDLILMKCHSLNLSFITTL